MTTTTPGLIAFLNARLDEDEAFAIAAAGADGKYGGRPHWSALGRWMVTDAGDPDWAVVDLSPCIEDASLAAHIARHDPARVLREVEADRMLLAALAEIQLQLQSRGTEGLFDSAALQAAGKYEGLLLAVKIRAARFGGHPDYRQEWKPS